MSTGLEANSTVKVIRDVAFKNANVGCSFGVGNSLVICPTPKPCDRDAQHRPCQKVDRLHHVSWNTSLYCPVTRKLVNESSGIFLLLQKSASGSQPESASLQLVKISRSYRATLHACIEGCADVAKNGDSSSDYDRKSELFHRIELIWHLCEILFLDVQPGTALLPQLQHWAVSHMTDHMVAKIKHVFSEEEPHHSSQYWDTVYLLVAEGRLDEARKLLRCHPQSSRDDFVALDELLESAPQGSQQTLPMDLNVWWQGWQEECQQRLRTGEFSSTEELETVCKILLGDEGTFYELRNLFDTWYHYLVAKVAYTEPVVGVHNLGPMAEECLALYGDAQCTGLLDGILLSLFKLDLQQVLREASLFLDSWWFSAHLCDLLFHGGQLEAYKVDYASQLREYLLLEYASSLMSHPSLWQVGVDYLDHCPRQGRSQLEVYLERIPLTTQTKALKVVSIAEQREMWLTAHSICHIVATRLQSLGQLGAALTWAIHSKDVTLTSRLADKLLLEYARNQEFSCSDVLENLGEVMLLSDRLMFLAKYREFHRETNHVAAAKLLVALVESELAPRFFWPVLLRDAATLLQSPSDLVLESTQVSQLLGCLETVSRSMPSAALAEENQPWTKGGEECTRLLLAENLANAFIQEGSCVHE